MSEKIMALPLEVRLFLESKMREALTNKEILALLNEKFPFVSGITQQSIGSYRNKVVPFYKELLLKKYGMKASKPQTETEIEEEILAEVKEAESTDEEFTKDEKQKTEMLKAHKILLKEIWQNYKAIKTSTEEMAKKNYLESALKVLTQIKELEETEKSFVASMAEVRKAEQKMTAQQLLDSIEGWWVPRLTEKCKDKAEAIAFIESLKKYLDDYKVILERSEDCAEAKLELLKKLYVTRKVSEDE